MLHTFVRYEPYRDRASPFSITLHIIPVPTDSTRESFSSKRGGCNSSRPSEVELGQRIHLHILFFSFSLSLLPFAMARISKKSWNFRMISMILRFIAEICVLIDWYLNYKLYFIYFIISILYFVVLVSLKDFNIHIYGSICLRKYIL